MTLSELGAKHGIHPTVIEGWKRQAMEGLPGLFDAEEPAAKTVSEADVEKLPAKTGQLLVGRDFLAKASRSMIVERAGVGRTVSHQSVDRGAMPAAPPFP